MAWTPVWNAGAESQNVNELDEHASYGSAVASVSNTKAKTGSWSFRSSTTARPRGRAGTFTQIRAGAFFNHNGISSAGSNNRAIIFLIPSTVGDIYVGWNGTNGLLELVVNGTVQDSIDVNVAGFSTVDTWYHCGITCKADSSSGFVSFYIDGVQVINWTGNTGTSLSGVYFAGRTSGTFNNWASHVYIDDFYFDSSDGSEADAAPNSYNIPFMLVNGAGDGTPGWTATGATPNYACVDETGAPNDNTDYVLAGAADLIDYYALTDYTIPAGRVVVGAYPFYWALKSDAGIATTITPGLRLSSTDADGSALTPATTYGPLQELVARPGGGSWSQSDINALQLKLKSSGAFS